MQHPIPRVLLTAGRRCPWAPGQNMSTLWAAQAGLEVGSGSRVGFLQAAGVSEENSK